MQSRKESAIETVANTTLGIIGSWLITIITLLLIDDKWIASVVTVLLCTVWSLARGYHVRRYFNARTG